MADRTEENGQAAWAINQQLQKAVLNGAEMSIPGEKAALVDEAALNKHLLDAMVYSGWSQYAGGGKNSNYQNNGSWEWPKFAAEQSAMGITEVVNSALSQQSKSLSSISTSVQKILPTKGSNL